MIKPDKIFSDESMNFDWINSIPNNNQSLIRMISTLQTETEEKALKEVLSAFLQREVTNIDAIKFKKIITLEHPNKYGLVYDNKPLGMMHRHFEGFNFRVEFIPGEIIF